MRKKHLFRLQFGMRTLLMLSLLFCPLMAWLGGSAYQYKLESNEVSKFVEKTGVNLHFKQGGELDVPVLILK